MASVVTTRASTHSAGVAEAMRAWIRCSAWPGANEEHRSPWLHMHSCTLTHPGGRKAFSGVDTVVSFRIDVPERLGRLRVGARRADTE